MQRTLETRLGLVDELVEPHPRAPYDLRAALKNPGGWFHPVHKAGYEKNPYIFRFGVVLCEPGGFGWPGPTRMGARFTEVWKPQGFHRSAHLSSQTKNWLRKNGQSFLGGKSSWLTDSDPHGIHHHFSPRFGEYLLNYQLGGGNSNIFYVHRKNWGNDLPIWLAHIFFRWVGKNHQLDLSF